MPDSLVGLVRTKGWAALVGLGLVLLWAAYIVLTGYGKRGRQCSAARLLSQDHPRPTGIATAS
jgi:hypothetical protein